MTRNIHQQGENIESLFENSLQYWSANEKAKAFEAMTKVAGSSYEAATQHEQNIILRARHMLGLIWFNKGMSSSKDTLAALQWLGSAVIRGYEPALSDLRNVAKVALAHGFELLEQRRFGASACVFSLIELYGDAQALYELAMSYVVGKEGIKKDIPHAINLLKKVVERGHKTAMLVLARIYSAPKYRDEAEASMLLSKYNSDVGNTVTVIEHDRNRLLTIASWHIRNHGQSLVRRPARTAGGPLILRDIPPNDRLTINSSDNTTGASDSNGDSGAGSAQSISSAEGGASDGDVVGALESTETAGSARSTDSRLATNELDDENSNPAVYLLEIINQYLSELPMLMREMIMGSHWHKAVIEFLSEQHTDLTSPALELVDIEALVQEQRELTSSMYYDDNHAKASAPDTSDFVEVLERTTIDLNMLIGSPPSFAGSGAAMYDQPLLIGNHQAIYA